MTFLQEAREAIAPARLIQPGPDRIDELFELESLVWSERPTKSAADLYSSKLDWDRTIAVEVPTTDGPVLGGLATSWGFDMPTPGGRLDVAGLTHVGVRPGFRRRGFLRALIAGHFDACRARGEAVSALFASEPAIYGRFGYGVASRAVWLTVPRGAALRPVDFGGAGDVEILIETADYSRHAAPVQEILQAVGHGSDPRPGWTTYVTEGTRRGRFTDDSPAQALEEPLRILIARRASRPVGYALFRRDGKWADHVPAATLEISGFEAADASAAHAMWSELLATDLVESIRTPPLPLDDPLLTWLVDWRTARPRMIDLEHVRLLDVRAALEARRYPVPVDIRISVTDSLAPDNQRVWRLVGGPDAAAVTAVDGPEGPADVALDVRELGALYLGGATAATLLDAGLIHELTPGGALALGRAFRGDREPGTPNEF
jgi:predicted acetyltransferase